MFAYLVLNPAVRFVNGAYPGSRMTDAAWDHPHADLLKDIRAAMDRWTIVLAILIMAVIQITADVNRLV